MTALRSTSTNSGDSQLARWAREQLEQLPLELTYRELPIRHGITNESLALVTSWLTAALDGKTQ